MGGCCNGRGGGGIIPPGASGDCKTLQTLGARMKLWPMATATGTLLTVATAQNGNVELGSFLSSYRCGCGVARLLQRNLAAIRAASANGAYVPYVRSGITVTDAIRVAGRAAKGARTNAAPSNRKVHPAL